MAIISVILLFLQFRRNTENLEDQIKNNHDLPEEEKQYLIKKKGTICLYEMKSAWMLIAILTVMELLVWWIVSSENTLDLLLRN